MSRPKKTPDESSTHAEAAAVQALVDQLLAAHGGDPMAALQAMQSPGGYVDQIPAAGGQRSPGAAFAIGIVEPSALADPPFGHIRPEHRFTLPEPPAQVSTMRVRIDIDEARPPIWRRLDLAGDLTLDELDMVIQAAFRWDGYHLHSFTPQVDGKRDRRASPFLNEGLAEVCDDALPDEGLVRLDQVVREVGDRLFYLYDFGDSWHHTLTVEKILPRRGRDPRAACLGGRRAGPPEDVGGIWRYNAIVAALAGDEEAGVDEDEMDELREWLGEDFDPGDAALDEIDLEGLLGTYETAQRWVTVLPGNPRLAPRCADVVNQAQLVGVLPVLAPMFDAAGLDLSAEPPAAARARLLEGLTAHEAEAALRPWRTLLAAIGPDGAELTAAGHLRPALVERLFTSLDMDDEWIGKGYREDLTPPVAQLRRAATLCGLVRKHKGRLVPTKAAGGGADPIRLWRHVADHLTRGREEIERHAAVLALLVLAADGGPDADRSARALQAVAPGEDATASVQELFRVWAAEVLGLLGWRSGSRGPGGWDAWHWSEVVWMAFDHPGCITAEGRVAPAGRRLAQAALLAG